MKTSIHVLTAIVFLIPTLGMTQPIINDANGIINDGETINISGDNFGQKGPNIVLYDEFDSSNVQDFDLIPTSSPIIGIWQELSGGPKYHPTSHSGKHSFGVNNGTSYNQFRYVSSTPFTEVFLSYWVKLANGIMPSASTPEEWNHGSNWKMSWIFEGKKGYGGDNDIIMPTWGSSKKCYITGNDGGGLKYASATNSNKILYLNKDWLTFTHWARFTIHMRADTNDLTGWVGDAYVQTINEVSGQSEKIMHDALIFDADFRSTTNITTKQWDRINIPGWLGNWDGNQSYFDGVYDDIYIATGENASARVEIGNASTYTACTNLALTTPTFWSDNSITTIVRTGSFSECDQVYLYVIDKDYNVNLNGYPMTITGSGCQVGLEKQATNAIKLYPNPIDQELTIDGLEEEEVSFNMKNILGEEVFIKGEPSNGKFLINTKHLPIGIYFLTIIYNNQESVHKIIKN